MIAIPQNYSDWVKILELLKNKSDDTEVLKVMNAGKIEWQSGVAERFLKRLTDSVNFRLNNATDKFQKEISRSGEEYNIVNSIINLRKELMFLSQIVDLPVIPEKQRAQLVSMVLEQANNIQNSLEESAKKDRSGKLSSIIRNNKVNSF